MVAQEDLRKAAKILSEEERVNRLERELLQRVKSFNKQVELRLSRYITTSGIDQAALLYQYQFEIRTLAAEFANLFLTNAQRVAAAIADRLGFNVAISATNPSVSTALEQVQQRIVSSMTERHTQLIGSPEFLAAAAAGTLTKSRVAYLRRSLTLTATQLASVTKYRHLLETKSSESLKRTLRDRRFDRSVKRSIAHNKILTETQVDRMEARFSERQTSFRAKLIASTEAVMIANQSEHVLYRYLINTQQISESAVQRKWVSMHDGKVRDTHSGLDGQKRGMEEPWVTSSGARLMFPGDPSAPYGEIVGCRCWISTDVDVDD